ncbi:protein phosphatase 1 regulatory subunit 3G [Corythoichthys intestinalis]|uniref:protein phosphatase 1 regulatory subunit 3G n=1 Tax=Corythoichthys intestinalis TaxID=161448 RepID=UPI0025A52E50|nr:protein phosphatase 1 regulatory subunit 3G [Corythoichthys intestinalis]XP_057680188.1 protein phosphatase 1 regulatory subunit 3G [Corythoichthys intestinalis]XP_061810239.1 protein phosphatase 1 regulatory subunit 3G-like [Nerophis lumbriciformis]
MHHSGLEPRDGSAEEEPEDRLDDETDARQLERRVSERRRARSLPAWPASPHKRVRFADSLGLSLASVKHFSVLEEPRVPVRALSGHPAARFTEPGDPDSRVRRLRVCLESVTVTRFDVRGLVRVLSGCGRPDVGVRYTFDDWLSHVDARALPLDGDRYEFTIYTPPVTEAGAAVRLAVYLRSDEGEFWDNNDGQNFTLSVRCEHFAATA